MPAPDSSTVEAGSYRTPVRKRPGRSPVAPGSSGNGLYPSCDLWLEDHVAPGPANTGPISRPAVPSTRELRIRRAACDTVCHDLGLVYYRQGNLKPFRSLMYPYRQNTLKPATPRDSARRRRDRAITRIMMLWQLYLIKGLNRNLTLPSECWRKPWSSSKNCRA